MSSLDPTAPDPASPGTPEPPTAAPALPPTGPGTFPWAGTEPAAAATAGGGVEDDGPDQDHDGEELPPRAPHRGGTGSGPGPAPGRLTLYLTVALITVLAFGSGVGVGSVTAPAVGTAPAATVPEGSPAPGASVAAGTPAPSPAASDPLAGLPSDGPLLGSRTAQVKLTYWADYQCPFCARFAQQMLPQLASRIADGTVSVLHRDFVFIGGESLDAAVAVRCAGEQGKYWPMHDAVYAAQNGENQGTFSATELALLAAGVGADATAFSACTQRHDVMVEVLADTAAGVRAGVQSTPLIDIPGRSFLGVPDAATLLAAIDSAAKTHPAITPAPSVRPSADPWLGTATAGRTAGSASARATVELWVDYQATGMPAIVSNLEPELRKRIATGNVSVVLRDLATLGDESVLAASFVRCGAEGNDPLVWFAHDILGASAQGANAGIYTSRTLLWLGAKLGWNVTAVDACMAGSAVADQVRAETASGTGMGLKTAPAVVVMAGGKETARFTGSSISVKNVMAAVDAAAK